MHSDEMYFLNTGSYWIVFTCVRSVWIFQSSVFEAFGLTSYYGGDKQSRKIIGHARLDNQQFCYNAILEWISHLT